VGHYTKAMFAEPNNATYPLNRAAAYLKLDKYGIFFLSLLLHLRFCERFREFDTNGRPSLRYQDAERDCEKVLQLDPQNIKGLFRRAQARAGVGKLTKAQAGACFVLCRGSWLLIHTGYVDLIRVIKIEPNNILATQELESIEVRIAKVEGKKKV
jgi:tetratricopeptide (TPR) repeat protein